MDSTQLEEVLRKVERAEPLDAKDAKLVRAVCESYVYMTGLVKDKNTSIQRLRKLLFGAATEKTASVVGGVGSKIDKPEVKGCDPGIARSFDGPGEQDGEQDEEKENSWAEKSGDGWGVVLFSRRFRLSLQLHQK